MPLGDVEDFAKFANEGLADSGGRTVAPPDPIKQDQKDLEEYDDFLSQRFTTGTSAAYAVKPEISEADAVEAIKLKDQTGYPLDVIQRNKETVRNKLEDKQFDMEEIRQRSPSVARWLQENPTNMAAGRKGIEGLSHFEKIWRSIKDSNKTGQQTVEMSDIGAKELFGEELTAKDEERLRTLRALMANKPDYNLGIFSGTPGAVAEQLPIMGRIIGTGAAGFLVGGATGAGVGALGGAPGIVAGASVGAFSGWRVASAYGAGKLEGALAYADYRDIKDEAGVPIEKSVARGAAVAVGVVNGALELVGLSQIQKTIPGLRALRAKGVKRLLKNINKSDIAKRYFKSVGLAIAGEGSTEFMQELVTSAGRELLEMHTNKELEAASAEDIFERIFSQENLETSLHAFKKGAQAGGGISVVAAGASVGIDYKKLKKAEAVKEGVTQALDKVAESKVAKELPGEVKKMVKGMSEDGEKDTAYIDPDAWEEYWQSKNIDADEAVVELLGENGTEELREAKAQGRNLEVPVADFVEKAVGSEHREFFQDNVKFDPDDYSLVEADKQKSDLDSQETEVFESRKEEIKKEGEIRARLKAKLERDTSFKVEELEHQVDVTVSALVNLAERAGLSLGELDRQSNLDIGGKDVKAEGELAQSGKDPDDPSSDFYDDVRANLSGDELAAFDEQVKKQEAEAKKLGRTGDEFTKLYDRDVDRQRKRDGQEILDLEKETVDLEADNFEGKNKAIIADNKKRVKELKKKAKRSNKNYFKQDKRGRIRFARGADGQRLFRIDLFKDADLSTFLHETGHFYLEVLGDIVEQIEGESSIKDDYKKILRFLGVKNRSEIKTSHHEKWAEAFERYLSEGRAPSVELRQAFAQFAHWLKKIYNSMTGVPISDEIRGVMDRILATDEEIAEARREFALEPLFLNEEVGFSAKEKEVYEKAFDEAGDSAKKEIEQKHKERLERKQKQQYKKDREEVKEQVRAEMEGEKGYLAAEAVRYGRFTTGEPLPEGKVKIRKSSLQEVMTEEEIKELPRWLVSRDGEDVGFIAEMFGFEKGGKDFIDSIKGLDFKKDLESRADVIMQQTHGGVIDQAALKLEVEEAVHTDKAAKIMQLELKHLASDNFAKFKGLVKKIARSVPTIKVVRAEAEATISRRKIVDIKPNVYKAAERRAGRASLDAFLKGDFHVAFSEKRKQLLNHELYRAAKNQSKETQKALKYTARFKKNTIRAVLGKAGKDYLEQADSILESYSFKKKGPKALEKESSLLEWVQEQNRLGNDIDVPAKILREAQKIHYTSLTPAELSDVIYTIKQIEGLAKNKTKLIGLRDKRSIEEAIDDIEETAGQYHSLEKKVGQPFARGLKEKITGGFNGFFAAHDKMEFIFQWLDGFKANGASWQAMFQPFAEAEVAESGYQQRIRKGLEDIFSRYSSKERASWFKNKIFVPALGGVAMTKSNMFAVALNMGNTYNKEALQTGYGWNDATLQVILDNLSKKDWETVQQMWDLIDSFWQEVYQHEKEISGVPPLKVEAEQVVTKHGVFKGGYYPISFDGELSDRQFQLDEKATTNELFGGNWARAMTRKGHTIARQNTGGKPINLDMNVVNVHLSNVTHDLAYRKAVINANKILNNDRFRGIVENVAGKEVFRKMRTWLHSIAHNSIPTAYGKAGKLLSSLRTGSTIVNMGFKMTTGVVQFLGYSVSAKELGYKWALSGLKDIYSQPQKIKERFDEIAELSTFMKERLQNNDRDIKDALDKLDGKNKMKDLFFFHIGLMDLAVSIPTWTAAFNKAVSGEVENIEKLDHDAAILYADSLVRTTQGSGRMKDLAAVQRGNELERLFTMFYSYFSVLYNQFVKTNRQLKLDGVKGLPNYLNSMFLLVVVPVILEDFILGRADEEELEEPLKWAAKKIASYPFMGVVGMRDVVSGFDWYGYQPTPVISFGDNLIKTGKTVGALVTDDKDLDEIKRGEARAVVDLVGQVAHLPTRQIFVTGEYFYHWLITGEEEPENPAELVWRSTVTGRKKEGK